MLKSQEFNRKWLFLSIGVISIFLSGPVLQIGITGWLIPIGALYFTRASKIFKGYLWTVLFMTIVIFISGLFSSPLPPAAVIVTAIISGVLEAIPFLLDRILYKRLNSRYSFLLFPFIAVSYEFLISFPLSSIGVLASTQTNFIELAQMASVTGVMGISFMMYWLAAILVPILANESAAPRRIKPYIITLGVILVFGIVKMRSANPTTSTVKVAGIVLEEYDLWEDLYFEFFKERAKFDVSAGSSPQMNRLFGVLTEFQKDPENERFKGSLRALADFQDHLLELTKLEAKNGSKIIVWSETNLSVFQKDEDEMLAKVKQIAADENVIIVTSAAVLLPPVEGGPMYENKSVLIMPDGSIGDTYEKSKPVPFLDASLPGDGKLEIVSTAYGKLTTAICYDADFPSLMTQSGEADILLLPSNDWLGVSPFHGDNAIFRAIENGVSVVRPTGTAQSTVFDPHGKVLARLEAHDKKIRIINAHVPIKGVTTIFNYIGNAFAWLCLIVSVMMVGTAIIKPVEREPDPQI